MRGLSKYIIQGCIALLLVGCSTLSSWGAWSAAPTTISLTAVYNGPAISFAVAVTNSGTTAVTVTWNDSINWFKTITPSSGILSVPANSTATFTMVVDLKSPWGCSPGCPIPVGTYTNPFSLTGGGQTVNLIATLIVNPAASQTPGVPGTPIVIFTVVPDPAKLTWNANTETDLAGYNVYTRFPGGTTYTKITSTTQPAANVGGLISTTTYLFTVTAFDTSGNESGRSNEVSYTAP